jgi:hypothetical protein
MLLRRCRFVGGHIGCVGPVGTTYGGPRAVIVRLLAQYELCVHDVGSGGVGKGFG